MYDKIHVSKRLVLTNSDSYHPFW